MKKKDYHDDTNLVHVGRAPHDYYGLVNLPVSHASSVIYKSLKDYETSEYRYARNGTPLSEKLEEAMANLEGGFHAVTAPSGFSAITTVFFAFLKQGDHVLVSDALYPPVRHFCDKVLPKYGIQTTYFDANAAKGIEKLIRKNTAMIYMESPGSGTFDLIDVPAVVAVARKRKIITVLDNSWAAGIVYKPLAQGVDVSVQSLTKYIGGHSDLMLGIAVAAREKEYRAIKNAATDLGVCAGADELYLALRGLRTVKVRLERQAENAIAVAKWLQKHPAVQRVYYPALPGHSGHKIWKRDFTGANSLFSVLLKPALEKKVHAFADSLKLFPIANSWGGYESLLQPQHLEKLRSATKWAEKGALFRLHVGLEDPRDLIADLERGLRLLS